MRKHFEFDYRHFKKKGFWDFRILNELFNNY
ncbi:hypothetical protein X924_09420 [Petrotoga sp. 9PWA.NaAc.5.4]|nr:hypothetical protein X924_09420 [Petrotoga sp. 9PWA.NaAc.5.4]